MPSSAARQRSLLVPALILAALGGALIAAQSRVNADLSAHLSPAVVGVLVTTLLSYIGTLLTTAVVITARGKLPWAISTLRQNGKFWWPMIGFFGVPIVITMAFGVPLVGVAVASVASVAGQTVTGLSLDAKGVGIPAPIRFTAPRVVAALVALAGLAVAVTGSTSGASTWQMVGIGGLIFLSGALISGQQVGNGRLNLITNDAFLPVLTSSFGGTVIMAAVVAGAAGTGHLSGITFPGLDQWWLYLGGPIGCGITAAAAWAIRHLGVFTLTLGVVVGQMVTAVAIDLIGGAGVSALTYVSVALVIIATAIVVVRRR
jgi:transporter family-2 protein